MGEAEGTASASVGRRTTGTPAVTDDIETFTEHLANIDIDPGEVVDGLHRLAQDFDHRTSFVLPTTGIRLEVASDGPIQVDEVAMDRLVALVMGFPHERTSSDVTALLACYHRTAVDARSLAGEQLLLLVAADPAECFEGLVLQVPSGGHGPRRDCDSAGLTVPAIELSIGLPGMEMARLSARPTIVVAPGARDPDTARRSLALVLVHELVHFLDNQMGNLPSAGGMEAYERRAYWVEETIARRQAAGQLHLPLPITYPSDRG